MEEEKKQLNWVPLYLAWDEEAQTVKMKVDKKEDFAMAAGLLFRMSEQAVKDALIDHSKEVSENEHSEDGE